MATSRGCKIKSSCLSFFLSCLLGRESKAACLHTAVNSIKAQKPEERSEKYEGEKTSKKMHESLEKKDTSLCVIPLLPLGAVGMAGMTLVVGLGVLEDKTVGPLQSIGALLHAVGSIFEVEAFYTLVRALRGGERAEEMNKEKSKMRLVRWRETMGREVTSGKNKVRGKWNGIKEKKRWRQRAERTESDSNLVNHVNLLTPYHG